MVNTIDKREDVNKTGQDQDSQQSIAGALTYNEIEGIDELQEQILKGNKDAITFDNILKAGNTNITKLLDLGIIPYDGRNLNYRGVDLKDDTECQLIRNSYKEINEISDFDPKNFQKLKDLGIIKNREKIEIDDITNICKINDFSNIEKFKDYAITPEMVYLLSVTPQECIDENKLKQFQTLGIPIKDIKWIKRNSNIPFSTLQELKDHNPEGEFSKEIVDNIITYGVNMENVRELEKITGVHFNLEEITTPDRYGLNGCNNRGIFDINGLKWLKEKGIPLSGKKIIELKNTTIDREAIGILLSLPVDKKIFSDLNPLQYIGKDEYTYISNGIFQLRNIMKYVKTDPRLYPLVERYYTSSQQTQLSEDIINFFSDCPIQVQEKGNRSLQISARKVIETLQRIVKKREKNPITIS